MAVVPVPPGSQRPLSITIIAWLLLIGCVFLAVNLLLKAPMVLFTTMITGWTAAIFCLAYTVANFFVGRGLLRLQPWARHAAIGLYGFGLLNAAVFNFTPGAHARILALIESQSSMFRWEKMLPNQGQFSRGPRPVASSSCRFGTDRSRGTNLFLGDAQGRFSSRARLRSASSTPEKRPRQGEKDGIQFADVATERFLAARPAARTFDGFFLSRFASQVFNWRRAEGLS